MKLLDQLKKMGLSEKEARVYLQLVHLGAQSASVLARRADINRTSTYDLLQSLAQRGLVQSRREKGRTLFSALHPSELLHFLEREKRETVRKIERQQEAVEAILPELVSLSHSAVSKPKLSFYEGEKGMREAYEDTLSAEGDILAYANVAEMHAALPNFFPKYYHRRAVEQDIHIKAIMLANEMSMARAELDEQENRESVLIPEADYGFSPEMNIYNDKVLIASWREKMAVMIESKEIADLHRQIFKLAWARAKELMKEDFKEGLK